MSVTYEHVLDSLDRLAGDELLVPEEEHVPRYFAVLKASE